jgi:hypothetical protein
MIAPKHKARSPSLLDCGLMAGSTGRALAMAELFSGRPLRPAPEDASRQPTGRAAEPNGEDTAEGSGR